MPDLARRRERTDEPAPMRDRADTEGLREIDSRRMKAMSPAAAAGAMMFFGGGPPRPRVS